MKKYTKLSLLVLTMLVIATGTFAYTTATIDEIIACVSSSNGSVRIISEPASIRTCNKNEFQLTWNKQGIQGVPGPQGEQGPAGPQGEPGVSNWQEDRIQSLEARVSALEGLLLNYGNGDDYLYLSSSPNDPESSTLQVEADAKSDWYTVFVFDLDSGDSDSDVLLRTLPVHITTSGTQQNLVIDDVEMLFGGDTYGDYQQSPEDGSGESVQYAFDLEDHVIHPNDEVAVEVRVRFKAQEGNYENLQTIQVSVEEADRANIEAQADGTTLADEFIVGTIAGEVHQLMTEGIFIVAASTEDNTSGENDTIGNFAIEFEITASGNDFYIKRQASDDPQSVIGVEYMIEGLSGITEASLTSSADEESNGVFVIREGETETFTLTVSLDPTETGLARLVLAGVNFTTNQDGVTDSILQPTLPVTEFRTGYLAIND